MQKTFQKFVVFELVERIARFRLLLADCADALNGHAPGLFRTLTEEAVRLEEQLLSQKASLNKLFAEGSGAAKSAPVSLEPIIESVYRRLQELSQVLLHINQFAVEPETYLFLKDALPSELTRQAGEQSVFLTTEGGGLSVASDLLPGVIMDGLPVLQKNNPLAWVGLTQAFANHLQNQDSAFESLKADLLKASKKRAAVTLPAPMLEALLRHAVNLRLLGPAYYFYAVTEAVLNADEDFLHCVEPALFFGLNHQNFTHKSLVILHEACERTKPQADTACQPLADEVLSELFRAVEKAVPAKAAFQEKNMERAIQLQERLNQGVLLSSTPLYPIEEVEETLARKQGQDDFSIYELLGMMTEYPHSPREIVNAGWLHKVERGPVWLYAALNEERQEGFGRITELLDYQDHLLRKSIEVSEVHRVLQSAV